MSQVKNKEVGFSSQQHFPLLPGADTAFERG